jgi:ABC-type phosphate transport system substrate-binding protein
VVVSKDSSINNITKKELSKIFLSKTKRLPTGNKSLVREHTNKIYQSEFYKLVCNKDEKQLKKYWAKMIFTGRGQPPKKIKSLKKLIEFVQNNKNAISYIPSKYMNDNLKIIMEIK